MEATKSTNENIGMLIDPKDVESIIDESLGLSDNVEAIYDEGNGIDIVRRFK